jgi:dolichol kinase
VISRPFALLFIPIDLIWNRTVLLILIGALALLFGAVDLVRLLSKVRLSLFFRKREAKRFSSMTKFLVSIFITFLVFRGEIPYLALAFITIGDLFSKVIGVKFGKIKLFKSRSLAGTLAFTGGCLMVGYILYSLRPMPLLFVLIGSPFAALVELFSESFDDNFTVGLISGGFLTAIRFFFPV